MCVCDLAKVLEMNQSAISHQLKILKQAAQDFIDVLLPKGRFCVITFHSLEDRIIKNVFSEASIGCTCPKEFPVCVCGKKPLGKTVTKKPVLPSDDELSVNPRARSAKLRIFEKY